MKKKNQNKNLKRIRKHTTAKNNERKTANIYDHKLHQKKEKGKNNK